MKVGEDTDQALLDLRDSVKRLRDLAHGVGVVHSRQDPILDKSSQTVERIADVLWREANDLCTAVHNFNYRHCTRCGHLMGGGVGHGPGFCEERK